MKYQFCTTYFELFEKMHQAAIAAENAGKACRDFQPYQLAVNEIKAHLDGCGQCKAILMEKAGVNEQ